MREQASDEEVFSFLEDLSFGMKSDCPDIIIHKFIVSLANQSPAFFADLRNLIYAFLYDYTSRWSYSISNIFRVNYDLSFTLPFWSHLASFYSFKEQLLCVLLLSATTLTSFQNDLEFMADLNDFMGVNGDFFLFQDQKFSFFLCWSKTTTSLKFSATTRQLLSKEALSKKESR